MLGQTLLTCSDRKPNDIDRLAQPADRVDHPMQIAIELNCQTTPRDLGARCQTIAAEHY
jgi:hypothetical protein